MNLHSKGAHISEEDLLSYERKLHSLELELARRKELGCQFGAVLDRQAQLFADDETGRENHQVCSKHVRNSIFILKIFIRTSMSKLSNVTCISIAHTYTHLQAYKEIHIEENAGRGLRG